MQGYDWISHYKNIVMGYPKTSFLSWLILGYPGISRMSSYPWIFQYKLGFGRVSFFQMPGAAGPCRVAWPAQIRMGVFTGNKLLIWSWCCEVELEWNWKGPAGRCPRPLQGTFRTGICIWILKNTTNILHISLHILHIYHCIAFAEHQNNLKKPFCLFILKLD